MSKSFATVPALHAVDFAVRAGQVHVLVGENGAGKSTLVSLLNGAVAPDHGHVTLDENDLPAGDQHAALAAGVVTVHQQLALVPTMTGLENIALAVSSAAGRKLRDHATEVLARYRLDVDLSLLVHDLDMPARQRLALARALCRRPRFLLLDEPTAYLPPTDIPSFLDLLRTLAADGVGIALITHRIEEVRAIADCGTVLRAGRGVASFSAGDMPSRDHLAALIAGHEVPRIDPGVVSEGPPHLRVDGLEVRDGEGHPVVNRLTLEVAAGSIVGLAGVDGNGQEPLLDAITGLATASSGTIRLGKHDITHWSARRRMHAGVRCVPNDRAEGIVPGFSIADHFRLADLPPGKAPVAAVLERYDVRPADPAALATSLSGGNQQKLLIALALEQPGQLLVLPYPTSGLDVDAQSRIYALLVDRARNAGTTILLASGELDELITICDRIVVLNRGRPAGEQRRGSFDANALVASFISSETEGEVTRHAVA